MKNVKVVLKSNSTQFNEKELLDMGIMFSSAKTKEETLAMKALSDKHFKRALERGII